MDVRDWFIESSYDYYDPVREKALRTIREQERTEGCVIDDKFKTEAIKVARIAAGPQDKLIPLHKMQRIYGAWMRLKEAEQKGETYDPLQDEELFLQQKDFEKYYRDLAAMSHYEAYHDKVPLFPFYEEARKTIFDEREWAVAHDEEMEDTQYLKAMKEFMSGLSLKELDHLVNGVQDPYVNPCKGIGRNDPCPCGSGKKYKKCCGRFAND